MPRTLREAVERGQISGEHPLPDGQWVFNREALTTPAAANLVSRVSAHNAELAFPDAGQASLDISLT